MSLRGDREIRAVLDKLSGQELQNRTRRGTRAGASLFRTAIRARAGSGGVPRRFRKTTTRSSGRTVVGTAVGPTSPLHNIFEGGAEGHRIAPRRGLLLSGPAGARGRRRAFAASEPVRHPGISARPLTTPIFEELKDDAADAAIDTILEGIR